MSCRSFSKFWLAADISAYAVNRQLDLFCSIGGQKGGIVVYVHESLKGSKEYFFNNSPTKAWEGLTITVDGPQLKKPLKPILVVLGVVLWFPLF